MMKRCSGLVLIAVAVCTVVGRTATQNPLPLLVQAQAEYSSTSGGDMRRLREIASGSTFEVATVPEMYERLRAIGWRYLRLINVDANFVRVGEDGKPVYEWCSHLRNGLKACKDIEAIPHIIVGHTRPPAFPQPADQWTDAQWHLYEQYVYDFFYYVLGEQGFHDAYWEVGNEPEYGMPWLTAQQYAALARPRYNAYLNLYRHISRAAYRFEHDHPELPSIKLGGLAGTESSFTTGDFNWYQQFLLDCTQEKLKLDFLSRHVYGNNTPLGQRQQFGTCPRFSVQQEFLQQAIREAGLDIPILITEWGASWHTNMTEGIDNANNVGAAYAAAFLDEMLTWEVQRSLYLVVADFPLQDGSNMSNWGWPSLFTYSDLGWKTKAPYNTFKMLAMMASQRVKCSDGTKTLGMLASKGPNKVTIMIWNYDYPKAPPAYRAQLRVTGLPFKSQNVSCERYLIDETHSNAWYLFKNGQHLEGREELQKVGSTTMLATDRAIQTQPWTISPYSVTLLVITPR